MERIQDFIARNGIRITCTRAAENPHMEDRGSGMDNWKCRLTCSAEGTRRSMAVPLSMGKGYSGAEPTGADLLDCLASDAAGVENNPDFEEWADVYGYDPDSRAAERIFHACERDARALRRFLGDEEYDRLLWHTERE